MTTPDKILLNVFGRKIYIQPEAYIVKVREMSPDMVEISYSHQEDRYMCLPVNTAAKHGKSASEFIKEFNDQVWKATNQVRPTYPVNDRLIAALINSGYNKNHKIGNEYTMDGKSDVWKISYYPIFECGKTGESYDEPRALVEKDITDKFGLKIGIDFREVPLRYLTKKTA